MKNNEIRIRRNNQDVHVKFNQLPIMPSFTIYSAARIDIRVNQSIVTRWQTMRLELNLKDQNFVDANNRELRPFAFICHDHKDKNAVARPIAKRLRQDLGTVWYDEFSIKVGDSLRESIESGIKSSDRCIIVLSKNFLKNETWAKREFDSIYIREIVEKKRVMLPIWVDITREDLYQYSPILADRAGQLWSDGLETVVGNLILAIRTTGNDDRNSETIDR